jgi:hypothetical protein
MKSIQISESRFNQLAGDVSRRLMDAYPFPGGVIRGEDIANFSAHKQVNNFVLFLIYQDWNNQFGRFINPNFDFDHADVREAMKKFLNVLSRHIKVRKEDFGRMVEKSVFNSLKLTLNPEEAFKGFFFQGTDRIPVETFQRYAGYFSDYDFALQSILKFLQKNQAKLLQREVFLEKFNKVCDIFDSMEGKSIVALQRFMFSRLTGLDLEQVIAQDVAQPVTPVAPPLPVEKKFGNYPPPPEKKIIPPPVTPPVVEKKIEITPPPAAEKKIEVPPPVIPPVAEKKVEVPPPVAQKETPTVNDLQEKKASLSDSFINSQREKANSLLEKLKEHQGINPPQSLASKLMEAKNEANPVVETPLPEVKTQEVIAPEPVVELPVAEITPEPQPEVVPIDLFNHIVAEPELTLPLVNEEAPKVADTYKNANSGSLHERLSVNNLKLEQIPVNKQFQFVQKIFGGSSVKFKVVLDKINQTKSAAEARDVLDKYVFNVPEANPQDKISVEFVTLVMNKFS